jgi:DNA-binding beta-propeller fold protein YncE
LRIAGAAAILAAVSAVTLLALGNDQRRAPSEPAAQASPVKSPTRPRPRRAAARLVGKIPVGERPADIALARGRVWVISGHATTIAGIDARRPSQAVNVGGLPTGSASIAAGFRRLWVANRDTDELLVLDPRRRRVQARVPLTFTPQVVRTGADAVWVLSRSDPDVLARVDPDTLAITGTVTLPFRNRADLAVGLGSVWVVSTFSDRLLRIAPATLHVRGRALAGLHPRAVAVGHGAVWVAATPDDIVVRFSPDLRRRSTIPVGSRPYELTAGAAGVWVSNLRDGTIMRLDARGGRRAGPPVRVGDGAYAMAGTRHRLWVALVDENLIAHVALR